MQYFREKILSTYHNIKSKINNFNNYYLRKHVIIFNLLKAIRLSGQL